ncbi:MAG TPA: hypothetical protein VM406_14215 [Noviherbaspirillum sp.]|nr:hypothetical protein [Noviherbaspirillum sp.]
MKQDLWLLKLAGQDQAVAERVQELSRQVPRLDAWRAPQESLSYLYLPAQAEGDIPLPRAEGDDWRRLRCTLVIEGAAAAQPVRCHYVVETDVLPECEDEFNAWYNEEHLPGLAAVPGTVYAARYVDTAGSPRYYACYGLTDASVMGSPAWLAVRGTAWSSRVRPTFRHTRRTMFEPFFPASAAA